MKINVVIMGIFLFSILCALVVGKIRALGTGTVAATVTPQNISVVVSDGNVSYGTVSLGGTNTTVAIPDQQHAANNGNQAETFNITSTHATNGVGWTLVSSITLDDQYMHQYSLNAGVGWTSMTTNYLPLSTNISVGTTIDFDLKIQVPNGTTDYLQKNITVTVQAVSFP